MCAKIYLPPDSAILNMEHGKIRPEACITAYQDHPSPRSASRLRDLAAITYMRTPDIFFFY